MSYYNRTYGGGWRAGMAARPLILRPDGTKIVVPPECPFVGRWQVIARLLWWEGYCSGLKRSLNLWLATRNHEGVYICQRRK